MRTGRTTQCCPAVDRVAGAIARWRDCLRVLSANANASSHGVCHIQHGDLTMRADTGIVSARPSRRTNFVATKGAIYLAVADEILLADLHAVVAENRVGG